MKTGHVPVFSFFMRAFANLVVDFRADVTHANSIQTAQLQLKRLDGRLKPLPFDIKKQLDQSGLTKGH
jgi:hypothetical protein